MGWPGPPQLSVWLHLMTHLMMAATMCSLAAAASINPSDKKPCSGPRKGNLRHRLQYSNACEDGRAEHQGRERPCGTKKLPRDARG